MRNIPDPRAVLASTYVRLGRYESGLSVSELAERAGVTAETIRRIEAGRSCPRRDTVLRVLGACRIDGGPAPSPEREAVAV